MYLQLDPDRTGFITKRAFVDFLKPPTALEVRRCRELEGQGRRKGTVYDINICNFTNDFCSFHILNEFLIIFLMIFDF